jgi:hypothetical protein
MNTYYMPGILLSALDVLLILVLKQPYNLALLLPYQFYS